MVKRASAPRDGETERKILDAAHVVFVRRGTGGARMQEIADDAGVNKALLHYYFRNKQRLADAVFHRVALGLFGRVLEVAASDLELDEKIRRIIAVYLDQMSRTPYAPAYLIGEMSQHPERAQQLLDAVGGSPAHSSKPQLLAKLAEQIAEQVAAGRITPIAPQQFLANLVSLCIFPFAAAPMLTAVLRLDEPGFRAFIEERKTSLPEFFLNALRP
ncbi:MAG: TetR/AcrR family transcriptional regulator [Gemmatimonadaceae bacterium]